MFIKLFSSYFVWVSTRLTLQDNKLSLSTQKITSQSIPILYIYKKKKSKSLMYERPNSGPKSVGRLNPAALMHKIVGTLHEILVPSSVQRQDPNKHSNSATDSGFVFLF